MIQFVKDLVHGEPAMSFGLLSTGGSAAVAVLVGAGVVVPLWLAVAVPVVTAVGAWYTRRNVSPVQG